MMGTPQFRGTSFFPMEGNALMGGASAPAAPMPAAPAPQQGKGKLDLGNLLSNFLMYYSAAQGSPLGMAGIQMQQQKRQSEADDRRKATDRAQTLDDQWKMFVRKEDYERANPAPAEIPSFVREYQWLEGQPTEVKSAYENFLRMRNPPTPLVMGAYDSVETPTAPSAPSGPPQAAIDHLKTNPGLAAEFEQKYGPGSAARVLGGAGQPGPRTFP